MAGGGGYVWWLAGLRVTLQTRYFLFICPQCVISTFRPGDTGQQDSALQRPTRLAWGPCHLLTVPTSMSRTSGRSGAAAGGTLGLAPCHPQGCKATVGTLFLKRRGRRGLSLEAGGCHHVGLSVPPSGLFLAGALPMAFTTPSGRDRCRGPWQPAGERWVPASSPLWAEGPGQGSLLRWQLGALGVTGPAVSAGRGRPAVYEVKTLTPALLLPSDPNVDGGDSLGHHPRLAPHRKLLA